MVESPQYKTDVKVTVDVGALAWHGGEVLELQPPVQAMYGRYSGAIRWTFLGWHDIQDENGSQDLEGQGYWHNTPVNVAEERQEHHCRNWHGDPMHIQKNLKHLS